MKNKRGCSDYFSINFDHWSINYRCVRFFPGPGTPAVRAIGLGWHPATLAGEKPPDPGQGHAGITREQGRSASDAFITIES
jgi:hypothetical protein